MRILRLVGVALCALVVLYWAGLAWTEPAGGGFKVLLAILALLVLTMAIALGAGRAVRSLSRSAGLALALYAPSGMLLLIRWIHDDFDRYLWIIRQLAPCTYMGGGPGALWVIVTSLMFALGAGLYALAGGITRRAAVVGVVSGATVTALTAAAMYPEPSIFARILGCL